MSKAAVKTTLKSNESTTIETQVYVGPTIEGVVKRDTFFNNGISDQLKKAIKEKPVLGSLVVPLCKFPDAKKEIQIGGAMQVLYQKAKEC